MRANISNGWELKNLKALKEAAQAEADRMSYLFTNAQKFISKVLSVFMDETYGRDTYMAFFKLINTTCPFLLMNDYRVSQANRSLRRVELL